MENECWCGKLLSKSRYRTCKKHRLFREETERNRKLSQSLIGNTNAPRGEDSPHWRGGKPKCIDCDVKIFYTSKRCRTCSDTWKKGENNPNWKGGYENTLLINRQRIIKKKNLGGHFTLERWNNLKKKYDYMCLSCKGREPKITLSVDHIVPVSVWESWIKMHTDVKYQCNDIENIQPLCRSCNSRKRDSIINFINNKCLIHN